MGENLTLRLCLQTLASITSLGHDGCPASPWEGEAQQGPSHHYCCYRDAVIRSQLESGALVGQIIPISEVKRDKQGDAPHDFCLCLVPAAHSLRSLLRICCNVSPHCLLFVSLGMG